MYIKVESKSIEKWVFEALGWQSPVRSWDLLMRHLRECPLSSTAHCFHPNFVPWRWSNAGWILQCEDLRVRTGNSLSPVWGIFHLSQMTSTQKHISCGFSRLLSWLGQKTHHSTSRMLSQEGWQRIAFFISRRKFNSHKGKFWNSPDLSYRTKLKLNLGNKLVKS